MDQPLPHTHNRHAAQLALYTLLADAGFTVSGRYESLGDETDAGLYGLVAEAT